MRSERPEAVSQHGPAGGIGQQGMAVEEVRLFDAAVRTDVDLKPDSPADAEFRSFRRQIHRFPVELEHLGGALRDYQILAAGETVTPADDEKQKRCAHCRSSGKNRLRDPEEGSHRKQAAL